MPADLAACKSISGDVAKLEAWAAIFEHPKELASRVAENMIFHYSEVMGDVKIAIADWKAADYENFGD